jgi:hypothetical protein
MGHSPDNGWVNSNQTKRALMGSFSDCRLKLTHPVLTYLPRRRHLNHKFIANRTRLVHHGHHAIGHTLMQFPVLFLVRYKIQCITH